MNATKWCARCAQNLPLDGFYPSQRAKNSSYCKRCSVAYQKERYRKLRGIPLDDSDLRLRRADEHHRWCAAGASYGTVHTRLMTFRGPASAHACSHCSKSAAEWAYDHSDPREQRGGRGAYSLDLERYFPLCKSCHKRYDNDHAGRGVDGVDRVKDSFNL